MSYYRSMADLYTRLAACGLDRKFVQATALPGDWHDERANTAEERARAETFIEQALGIPADTLANHKQAIELATPRLAQVRPQEALNASFHTSIWLASRTAELAAQAQKHARSPWLQGLAAEELREHLIGTYRVVRLSTLLDCCWGLGVPVIRITRPPGRNSVLDVIALQVDSRPFIAVSSRHTASAWELWHIAHALGHIAHGHLEQGACADIRFLSRQSSPEEAEAQRFADTLVHGDPVPTLKAPDRITGVKLARLAQAVSRQHGVEVGSIVTRFALTKALGGRDARGPANRALRCLGIEDGGPQLTVNAMAQHLTLSQLNEGGRRFLCRVTGWEPD